MDLAPAARRARAALIVLAGAGLALAAAAAAPPPPASREAANFDDSRPATAFRLNGLALGAPRTAAQAWARRRGYARGGCATARVDSPPCVRFAFGADGRLIGAEVRQTRTGALAGEVDRRLGRAFGLPAERTVGGADALGLPGEPADPLTARFAWGRPGDDGLRPVAAAVTQRPGCGAGGAVCTIARVRIGRV